MKKHLLSVLVLPTLALCMSTCFSCKSPSNLPSFTYKDLPKDSTLNKLWGDSISDIINNPTLIRAYRMYPDSMGKGLLIGNYAIKHPIGKLELTYASPLLFFLNDKSNFNLSEDIAKTPFMPTIAFEFQRQKENVFVVISFNGNQLVLIYNDKEIIRKQFQNPRYLLRLSVGLQPQDEYLNYMLNQQKSISK
ncbi:hypothetical protein [Bacteroides muris (ex Fokt et al. 2023)]|uniref:DUF4251 domain-containing protein n=1 Tax=Bacteroides muris (ex Fokt et al. 2023) TaxID=2937417 RepID=A0A9X2NQD5_9BACE|nr:hypothetical protein [Bacteroides muris (ex Fokt et al. 2023)]MCR6503989.1 hypothetical protein [Bacteroides muris (ex Fokt et al. 2023)]